MFFLYYTESYTRLLHLGLFLQDNLENEMIISLLFLKLISGWTAVGNCHQSMQMCEVPFYWSCKDQKTSG